MNQYLLYHRHAGGDCAAAFAAWNGFDGELRGAEAISTCVFGGHEIWWRVEAADQRAAVAYLPSYVAERTLVLRVAAVTIP